MVTMSDIARLSGVARSTVHATLTGKPWVSEKTRQKVLETVRRYNYQPNRMASALVGRASNLIGLILRDILNPFNSQLVEGIHSVLSANQYSTLFLNALDRHDLEVQAVQMALGYQVDGLIMAPLQLNVDLRHLYSLREQGKPFVTLGPVPGIETSHVCVDEQKVGFLATEHLIAAGHQKISFLRGPRTAVAAELRLEGYRSALIQHQLPLDPALVIDAGSTLREGQAAAALMLDRPSPRPTAMVCYNDLVAAGVYKAAHDRNLRIPDDLSVVGIDDIELAGVFGPPLTTIAQPCFALGAKLAEILLGHLRGDTQGVVVETLGVKLVERQSVRRL